MNIIKATDPSSSFTSFTDRCRRKENKQLYQVLKNTSSLNSQIKTCKRFLANAQAHFPENGLENPPEEMKKEREALAYRIFYAKETCKLFIKKEEDFYKTDVGSFIHSIQQVFKKIFGWKTSEEKIQEANELIASIEKEDGFFEQLISVVNKEKYESYKYRNNIYDQHDLENALITWQENFNFKMKNDKGILTKHSIEIADFNQLIAELKFPKTDATKLMHSEVIELNSVPVNIIDLGTSERFSYKLNLSIMRDHSNHWYILSEHEIFSIGEGSTKSICKGWDLSCDEPVAIGVNTISVIENTDTEAKKNVKIRNDLSAIKRFKREYGLFQKHQLSESESIVGTRALFIKKPESKNNAMVEKKCYFILELYDCSMDSRIYKVHKAGMSIELKNKITIEDKVAITMDVIKGIKHLHDRGLIHSDIKPDNILLKKIGEFIRAFVADLDLAFSKDDKEKRNKPAAGTLTYIPPEELNRTLGNEISQKFDIWSLGVTLYALYYGKDLFLTQYNEAVKRAADIEGPEKKKKIEKTKIFRRIMKELTQAEINEIFETAKNNDGSVPEEINNFIKSLMQINQKKRPNINKVMRAFEETEAYKEIRSKLLNPNVSKPDEIGNRMQNEFPSEIIEII
jgi:serine/threonine protein kinase